MKVRFTIATLVLSAFLCLVSAGYAQASLYNYKVSGTLPVFASVVFDPYPKEFNNPRLSPNDRYVVYVADATTDGLPEIYSAAADGSTDPVRISPVISPGTLIIDIQISPDSSRVVYIAN